MTRKLLHRCKGSDQRSRNYPGRDQCDWCGKVVLIRKDGTIQPHNEADEEYWRKVDEGWA